MNEKSLGKAHEFSNISHAEKKKLFHELLIATGVHPLDSYLRANRLSVPEFAAMCRVSPPTILRIIKNEKYGGIKASKRTIRQILRRAKTLTWKDFGYEESR